MQVSKWKGLRWTAAVGGLVLGLSACGSDHNLFGGLADDNTIEATIQEARSALDRGDCETAINGFTEVFQSLPNDVNARINLAAAYACRAGFDVPSFIGITAQFVLSGQTPDAFSLFKSITDGSVKFLSATWDADTTDALLLLADPVLPPPIGCSAAPFGNDPNAAFNQAIISTIRATMAVSSLQDPITGEIPLASADDTAAALIGGALRAASDTMACSNAIAGNNVVASTDLAQVMDLLDQLTNGADGDLNDALTGAELQVFLSAQGFTLN